MGLLLSVLVGCIGVLELLACMRQLSDKMLIKMKGAPAAPCLSYHDDSISNFSVHDSLCSISHSKELHLPRSAKQKLENLHEYSLRVRNELRALDKNFDCSTLSECSTRDLLDRGSRPDSRQSFDLDFLLEQKEKELLRAERADSPRDEEERSAENGGNVGNAVTVDNLPGKAQSLTVPQAEAYVRVPTPIPLGLDEEVSDLSSSEIESSFDNDSENEVIRTKSIDSLPVIKRFKDSPSSDDESAHEVSSILRRSIRRSKSKSPDITKGSPEVCQLHEMQKCNETSRSLLDLPSTTKLEAQEKLVDPSQSLHVSRKKCKAQKSTTTILRKATRLKSKNAEISKSAENLGARRSKRQRDPERRKSDISVQTISDRLLIDEWTNTSPPGSQDISRAESKNSVSVEVQTSFDAKPEADEFPLESENSVLGLSEGKRDLHSRERLAKRSSFKRRKYRSIERSSDNDRQDEKEGTRFSASIHPNVTVHTEESSEDSSLKIRSFQRATEGDYERIRGAFHAEVDFRGHERESREINGGANKSATSRRKQYSSTTTSHEDDDEFVDADDLIFSGEYTKAMNKDWHSGHFCCWQCDESLTGQRYVLRDEHPYCIKCYESVFANGCEECNKIIGIDSKDLSYKDKHWHEACFLCNRCKVSLVDKQFGSKVDKIYCGNCYDAQFASRCDGCGEIFRAGTKKMEYKTRQWHEKCFCCVVCKNPIGTKSFIPREQEIYCAACYEDKFATRCVKCNKIITSGGVTYKNEPWHRDCFTCSNCNNSLAGQRFTSRDDKPYCAECFGELFAKRCTACSKPITGIGGTRFISFEDRHWHNDCFICAGCKTSLVGRGFITDGDDIICPECAKMKLM